MLSTTPFMYMVRTLSIKIRVADGWNQNIKDFIKMWKMRINYSGQK